MIKHISQPLLQLKWPCIAVHTNIPRQGFLEKLLKRKDAHIPHMPSALCLLYYSCLEQKYGAGGEAIILQP